MPPGISIPQAVLSTTLDGEAVILHMDTRRYYQLNETATAIWEVLERGQDGRAVVDALCRDYDVARDEAAVEVERVLRDLEDLGLIVRTGGSAGG